MTTVFEVLLELAVIGILASGLIMVWLMIIVTVGDIWDDFRRRY